MIRIFRTIRQKLFSENKFSRYLLYAIGEIVLVVLGILIALGINNWNSERNEKLKYLKQLSKVVQSIKSDSIQLENLKQSRFSASKIASGLIKQINDRNVEDPEQFFNSFLVLTGESKFVSDLDKQVKNQFENYQNAKIHELLDGYQKLVEEIEFREFRHNEFSENLEADLWKNGFFRKVGTKFKTDENGKRYYSSLNNIDLSEIGLYSDESLFSLCLRAELDYLYLMTEYELLIMKGTEINQSIITFINKNE